MEKFKITRDEWILAIIFFILWFIFSSNSWILFLDSLTPLRGWIVYYVIIFLSLFILAKLGLVIFNIKVKSFWQILGTTLIFFCFFVIFNFENPYIQYVSKGDFEGCSHIFFQSEDGILWAFWYNLTSNINITRFLIGASIFVLVLFAELLIERRAKFDLT